MMAYCRGCFKSVGHVKATFSQCFAKQGASQSPSWDSSLPEEEEKWRPGFWTLSWLQCWAAEYWHVLCPSKSTVCRPWCLVLSNLCVAPIAFGTGHGNPSPCPAPHPFSCPCRWTQWLFSCLSWRVEIRSWSLTDPHHPGSNKSTECVRGPTSIILFLLNFFKYYVQSV